MEDEIKMRINDIEDCSRDEKLVLDFLFAEASAKAKIPPM
jgi:hypothetical protein